MIPTMLLFGLVAGRFWAVPIGALAWAAIVVLATSSHDDFVAAAALGAANAVVGVAARKAFVWSLHARRPVQNG